MTYESIWLDCTFPGCDVGTPADPRHLANLTASGGWECHLHDHPEAER